MPPTPTNLLGTWEIRPITGHDSSVKRFVPAEGHGAFIDLLLDDETHIALSDGVNLRYHAPGAEVPPKYQLLIAFDDDSFLVFTVAMYGGIIAFRKHLDNPYYLGALSKPSPLDDAFDEACFGRLISDAKSNLSAKAFLATEQRIPGLGNGVLQDILFKSHIHPKRRLATLGDAELGRMYSSVKSTLRDMGGSRRTRYGERFAGPVRRLQDPAL